MIQFLLPAGLLAAAGILVPVLLHLWRPPGRTVRLGSLRFLDKFPGRRMRDLRWRDRLLLFLRVILLLVLAALLAEPHWSRRRDGPQRWILRLPDVGLDEKSESEWQRLLAEGYEPRLLAPGFPAVDVNPSPDSGRLVDAWSLLREAAARLPAGSQIVLFAPPRISSLRGSRPAFANVQVRWIPTAASATTGEDLWIEAASVTTTRTDGLRATIGRSDADAIRFSMLKIADLSKGDKFTDPVSHAEITLRTKEGPLALRLAGSRPHAWLPVISHRPVRVSIVYRGPRERPASGTTEPCPSTSVRKVRSKCSRNPTGSFASGRRPSRPPNLACWRRIA